MMIEKNHIDQLFKEKLGNFEKNPRADLLAQILSKSTLPPKSIGLFQNVKTLVGIAAATLIVCLTGWMVYEHYPSENTITFNKPKVEVPESTGQMAGQMANARINQNPSVPNSQKTAGVSIQKENIQQGTKAVKLASGHGITSARKTGKKMEPAATATMEQASMASALPDKTQDGVKKDSTNQKAGNSKISLFDKVYISDASSVSGNTPQNKKSDSRKNWSLKAQVSTVFTPQQSGNPYVGTDTKSIATLGGGMIANYKINQKLSISSGIVFSQMKQNTISYYTVGVNSGISRLQSTTIKPNITGEVAVFKNSASSPTQASGNETVQNFIFGSNISQGFQYLEVPVQAVYKVIDKKISLGLSGGVSTNFLVGNFVSIAEDGVKKATGKTDNIRGIVYAGSAGIELGYDLGNRMTFTFEPRIKQYLNSISKNEQINYRPIQFGIFTGIIYTFE